MIIRDTTWEKIRGQFSETDKAVIRQVIDGEVLCPRGWLIGESRLPRDLKERLTAAIAKLGR